jgi:glucose-6-phosphate isomerase
MVLLFVTLHIKEGKSLESLQEPILMQVDLATGFTSGFSQEYSKKLAELQDIYQVGIEPMETSDGGESEKSYSVSSTTLDGGAGALTMGITTIEPKTIGAEYMMTRGHLHQRPDRSEMYLCLSGTGLILLENLSGEIRTLELTPGSMAYIPGYWIHRSINVGVDQLILAFCFSADAGQNYRIIKENHGMSKIVVTDGFDGWELKANPNYVLAHGKNGAD